MTDKPLDPIVCEAVLVGLAELRRRIKTKTLSSLNPGRRRGGGTKHFRQNLFLTPTEVQLRRAIGHALSLHLGQTVAQSLVMRLALYRLATDATASLRDTELAATLKTELLAVRNERIEAPKEAAEETSTDE